MLTTKEVILSIVYVEWYSLLANYMYCNDKFAK